MSTDIFRRYLDLLNEATGQPPTDFTPTHFHKNNLGSKIPLMQTPDGNFWWETTATSDDGGSVQKGAARKSIQPWTGDTENRSSGLSGKSSVDGVFKNGEAIEFPEGMTWKEYAAKSRSPQAALPSPVKVKEIPHINPGELIAPNAKLAPSSGTFTNDQALANLAAQMKDVKGATTSLAAPTGSKIDSPESLELLRKVKALAGLADALPPIDLTKDPDQIYADLDIDKEIIQRLTSLVKQAGEISNSGGDMSDITKQQVKDISISTTNKMLARIKSVKDKFGGEEKAVGGSAASGSASGAAAGSDSGARWAFVPGDGTSKDISAKKDAEGIAAGGTKLDRRTQSVDKETVISGDSHCAQCGTPKSLHAPLKHEFVPGNDVRPESVGGSAPRIDSPAVDRQPKTPTFTPGGSAKRGGVSTTPGPAPAVPPKGAPSKPSFFKEDIDRLPVADQMRSWQRLMEADPPRLIVGPDQFDTPEQIRARAAAARNAGKPAAPPPETPAHRQINPNSPLGRAQAAAIPTEPMAARGIPGMDAPAAPAPAAPSTNWKAKAEFGLKKLAKPLNAAYAVYEGWQQISALPRDKMSKAEYAAAITKIVAKLVEENGIFLVSSELGMLAGGALAGVGAIPGFIAGGAAGIAAEYYFGDDISAVVNGLVDKLYGTGKGPAPASQENKLNPQQIGELKQWAAEMDAWVAAGNKLEKDDQDYLNRVKAALKAAGVTITPAVPTGPVAKYKATFDKANGIVDQIKNLDPKDPILEKTAWKLISELTSLYASEIGQEGANDPAVKAQMDSVLAAAKAAAEKKYTEADAVRQSPPLPAGGPKEGQTGMYDGKKVIYRNGKWVYQ